MNQFDDHRIVFGRLSTDSDSLENVRCEVFLNRLDSTEMKADVFDVSGGNEGRFLKNFMGRKVIFEAAGSEDTFGFEGLVNWAQIASGSDRIGSIAIDKHEEIWSTPDVPIVNGSVTYYVTPIQMFKRRRLVTQHDLKGLLLGWRGALDPNDNSWQDDTVPYDTEAGRIVFYPGVAFADTSDDSTVVREQLKIVAALTGDLTHIKSTRKVLDQIVGQYLHMASFFEQHLCDWFRVDIEGRGNEEKGFSLSSYKRLAATKSFELYHIKKYAGQYASLLPIAVKKFNFLAEAVRTNVDKAINQMLYGASSDQSIENKLVYLHSCLDIMIKTVGDSKDWLQKSEGFSRKLVLACEDTGIQWLDLYPYLNKQAIFSNEKVDFRINQYRNQIIHEGTYPEFNQYQELTEENSRARALFERLVMAVLGMYDQNSPIGQLRIN